VVVACPRLFAPPLLRGPRGMMRGNAWEDARQCALGVWVVAARLRDYGPVRWNGRRCAAPYLARRAWTSSAVASPRKFGAEPRSSVRDGIVLVELRHRPLVLWHAKCRRVRYSRAGFFVLAVSAVAVYFMRLFMIVLRNACSRVRCN